MKIDKDRFLKGCGHKCADTSSIDNVIHVYFYNLWKVLHAFYKLLDWKDMFDKDFFGNIFVEKRTKLSSLERKEWFFVGYI